MNTEVWRASMHQQILILSHKLKKQTSKPINGDCLDYVGLRKGTLRVTTDVQLRSVE